MANAIQTSHYANTDALLRSRAGIGLAGWLRARVPERQAAHPRGWADWRSVAAELSEKSGAQVSHDTVRRWWHEIEKQDAA